MDKHNRIFIGILGALLANSSFANEYVIRVPAEIRVSNWEVVGETSTTWADIDGTKDCKDWGLPDSEATEDYIQSRGCSVDQERIITIDYEDRFSGAAKSESRNEYRKSGNTEDRTISVSFSGWVNNGAPYNCSSWVNAPDSNKDKVNLKQIATCNQLQDGTYSHYVDGTYLLEFDKQQVESQENQRTFARDNESCNTLYTQDSSLLSGDYSLESGTYTCEMSNGGWTKLSKSVLSNGALSLSKRTGEGYWSGAHYVLGDTTAAGGLDATVTTTLPFTYSSFYFSNFQIKGFNSGGHSFDIGRSTLGVKWSSSANPTSSYTGDFVVGSTDAERPTVSFSSAVGTKSLANQASLTYPNSNIHNIGLKTNKLSFRAVESGSENENLSIWSSGYIYVR